MLPDVLLQAVLCFANDRSLANFARSSRFYLAWCKRTMSLRCTWPSYDALELMQAGWKFDALSIRHDYAWVRLQQVWTPEARQGLKRITFDEACDSGHEGVFDCKNLESFHGFWHPTSTRVDFSGLKKLTWVEFRTHVWVLHKVERITFGDAVKVLAVNPGYARTLPFIQASGLTRLNVSGRLPPEWQDTHMPRLERLEYCDAHQNLEELLRPFLSARLTQLDVSDFSAPHLDLCALSSFESNLRSLSLNCKQGRIIHIDQSQFCFLPRTLEMLFVRASFTSTQELTLDFIGQRCQNLAHVDISFFSHGLSVRLNITAWSACSHLSAVNIQYLNGPFNLPDDPKCIWPSLKFMELRTFYTRYTWLASSQCWK